jgi:hypothetical protein
MEEKEGEKREKKGGGTSTQTSTGSKTKERSGRVREGGRESRTELLLSPEILTALHQHAELPADEYVLLGQREHEVLPATSHTHWHTHLT